MSSSRFLTISVLVMLLLFGAVQQVFGYTEWTNGVADDWSWATSGNWTPATLPTTAIDVSLNIAGYDNRCVIDTGVTAIGKKVIVGRNAVGPSYLCVLGGSLTSEDNFYVGGWGSSTGVMDVNGGTVTMKKTLFLGQQSGAYGTLTQNGGSIDVNYDVWVPGYWSAVGVGGRLNLYGGTLACRDLIMDYGDKGLVDVTDGTLRTDGDDVADLAGFVEDGLLVAYGGNPRGSINIKEDGPFTYVTASLVPDELAFKPSPADNAVMYALDAPISLSWGEGEFIGTTNKHDVYVGFDYNDVNDAGTSTAVIYKGRQDANTFGPLDVEMGVTYYWRVDEVNEDDSSVWKGAIWKFSVPYIVIDDMEDYVDEMLDIYSVWMESGGAFLYEEDESPIRGGDMAMKMNYNGSSTVTRTFAAAQDWTVGQAKAVVVYFQSQAGNTGGPVTVTLTDSDSDASNTVQIGDGNDLNVEISGYSWNAGNALLSDLDNASFDADKVKSIAITVAAGTGSLYVDDIRLYPSRCTVDHLPVGDLTDDCVIDNLDLSLLSGAWLDTAGNVTAVTPDNNRLQVHYKFDETSGYTASDETTNGYDASIAAAGVWATDGYDGGCIDMFVSGAGHNVVAPAGIFDDISDEITISIWVKGDTTSIGGGQIAIGKYTGTWCMGLYTPVPGRYSVAQFSIGYDANSESTVYDTVVWYDILPGDWQGEWVHYAFVKDATVGFMGIYRNGELVEYTTDADKSIQIDEFGIGNSKFEGKLDDLRIYDYALSQSEVISLAGKTQVYQPLLLNEPYSDDLIDFKDFAALADNWLAEILWP
jgi:hypothetical protein